MLFLSSYDIKLLLYYIKCNLKLELTNLRIVLIIFTYISGLLLLGNPSVYVAAIKLQLLAAFESISNKYV